MKREYELSRAVRGKFFRPGAELVSPLHLDPEVVDWLQVHAESEGKTLSDLVNELLKKDIEVIEAAK